jgi:hypothetical protein
MKVVVYTSRFVPLAILDVDESLLRNASAVHLPTPVPMLKIRPWEWEKPAETAAEPWPYMELRIGRFHTPQGETYVLFCDNEDAVKALAP